MTPILAFLSLFYDEHINIWSIEAWVLMKFHAAFASILLFESLERYSEGAPVKAFIAVPTRPLSMD
jgi:hypothetical protein